MPKEQFLEKVTSKIHIYLHWTKPKIFIFSSDYKNWQKVKLAEKLLMILNATSKYSVIFLYLFWITTIFQAKILFKTNNIITGGPLGAEGPGQLPPLPPINPALNSLHRLGFNQISYQAQWKLLGFVSECCKVHCRGIVVRSFCWRQLWLVKH